MADEELEHAQSLEEATGELRAIARGPGGWAAGTVMEEYDHLRAQLAAQALIVEAATKAAEAWRTMNDYAREHVWRGSEELVVALDALAAAVEEARDE